MFAFVEAPIVAFRRRVAEDRAHGGCVNRWLGRNLRALAAWVLFAAGVHGIVAALS